MKTTARYAKYFIRFLVPPRVENEILTIPGKALKSHQDRLTGIAPPARIIETGSSA
jgi:hypothetical protein